MSYSKFILGAVFSSAVFFASGFAQMTYRGTVVDNATSNGIPAATVKLAIAMASTETDANGEFSLIIPEVPIRHSIAVSRDEGICIKGGAILFSVPTTTAKATADVYSINGRFVTRILQKTLSAGSYSLTPRLSSTAGQLYVVKLSVGAKSLVTKMNIFSVGVSALQSIDAFVVAPALEKTAGAIDTLIITKSGYRTARVQVSSYYQTTPKTVLLNIAPPPQELAMYSERVTNSVWTSAGSCEIQVWETNDALASGLSSASLDANSTLNPYPGTTKCFSSIGGTIGWSSWGWVCGAPTPRDYSGIGFEGGDLHLYIRGDAESVSASVGWQNGYPTNVDLAEKGYLPDGKWHEVTIPFSDFGEVDFTAITWWCMLISPIYAGAPYTPGQFYAVSDVTWRPATR